MSSFFKNEVVSQSRKRKALFGAILILILLLIGAGLWWRDSLQQLFATPRLPEADEVEAMSAYLGNSPQNLPDLPDFVIPPKHISQVLAALHPAEQDANPAKWQGLGNLFITTKDGRSVMVDLYWTSGEKGAFSVRGTAFRNGVYFRGGTDKAIEDAIREAYADSIHEPE
jgi:hypothetical protein